MRKVFLPSFLLLFFTIATFTLAGPAQAGSNPLFKTKAPFLQAEKDLTRAIKKNKMGLVSKASATHGAP